MMRLLDWFQRRVERSRLGPDWKLILTAAARLGKQWVKSCFSLRPRGRVVP